MKYILIVYLILTGEPNLILQVQPVDGPDACTEAVRSAVADAPTFLQKHQELMDKGAQLDVTCVVAAIPGKSL